MTGARISLVAAAAVMVLALAACMRPTQPGTPVAAGPAAAAPTGVITKTEHGGRYLVVIGPRQQHGEPFFGITDTNYFALRSLIDRTTGQASHQLLVEDSYGGADRHWDAAHDGWGQTLRFIPISHNELACESGKCSYAEEFAAAIPEPELRGSPRGLEVTFTDKAGDKKTIAVSSNMIAIQVAAFDAARASPGAAPAAAARPAGTPPPPSAASSAASPPIAAVSPTAGMPPPSAFSSTTSPPAASAPPPGAPAPPGGGMTPPSAFSSTAGSPQRAPAAIPPPTASGMPPPSAFSSATPAATAAGGQPSDPSAAPTHPHRHAKRQMAPGTAPQGSAPDLSATAGGGYGASASSLPEPVPTEPIAQPGDTTATSGAPIGSAVPPAFAPPPPAPASER